MAEPSGHTTQLQNWLDLMRTGNAEARERLIEHACERLRRITRKMLRDSPRLRRWEETDDVLVEVLTKLHRSLASVQPESARAFYNLAATQIRRVLIDMARRYYGPLGEGWHHESGEIDGGSSSLRRNVAADRSGEPANLMEWTEFHEQVEALPNEGREVFDVLWYVGLPQEAAAAALGISPSTLRRRWQQARLKIYKARHGEQLPE